ncbi:MAG: DNA polymerase/3'-5' exonuclease PolX [Gammaproteobacteria bacterium]|nr:DNA polymerase/3'-5' exonuclease PolX [Gammaproteobacteria bacterium]
MPVRNSEIADIFEKLADLLEIEESNPFRVRAYRNAAQSIRGHGKAMADLLEQGADLSELPDIGEDLAEKIQTIVTTGELPLLNEVESRTPAALSDMMRIEGLGPKRVKTLYKTLDIKSIDDLKRAARSGKIREIPGFGKKTEDRIRTRVEGFTSHEQRVKLCVAEQIAEPLVDYLRKVKGVKDIVIAGSFRRRKETVGDLDILIAAARDSIVMDRFVEFGEVVEVISKGRTRARVRLRCGMSVDVRVVPAVSFGAALVYFTGSKQHNIAIRKMGVRRNLKINEYGVFRDKKRVAGKSEKSVYASVGLPVIVPELRENRGELQAARKNRLPHLITMEDIRGDLHCHTRATDGRDTPRRMAEAAAERGYEYLSINDHSKRVAVANGLDRKRLLKQIKEIDKLNEKLDGIELLKSVELDILQDGSLDLPDSVIKELDFTVCAVHYGFNLSRRKQTDRVLRAMDNPYFNILAHPTGRLINEREPYPINLEAIMKAAKERGCFLELNAHPDRLDLTDDACLLAKEIQVRIAVSTDAHSASDLRYMRCGIDQARRGWLEKTDIINTLSLSKLKELFARR